MYVEIYLFEWFFVYIIYSINLREKERERFFNFLINIGRFLIFGYKERYYNVIGINVDDSVG